MVIENSNNLDYHQYKAELRQQIAEKEKQKAQEIKDRQDFFIKESNKYTQREEEKLQGRVKNSYQLRKKCENEWISMVKGKQLEEKINKDINVLHERVVRGGIIQSSGTHTLKTQSSPERSPSKQVSSTSWAVSSNRKNQPSDVYTWGVPSNVSNQISTYETMFGDPAKAVEQTLKLRQEAKQMKIEDQLNENVYQDIVIPPALFDDPQPAEEAEIEERDEESIDAKSVDNDSVNTPRTNPEEEKEDVKYKTLPMKLNSKRLQDLNSRNGSIDKLAVAEKSILSKITKPDVIFETKSQVPTVKSRGKSQYVGLTTEDTNLRRITKETLQKLNNATNTRIGHDTVSKQHDTASGIKSLIIKKRVHLHSNEIFGNDQDKKLMNETLMNKAQLDAFKRYIANLEQEAIQDKRFSIKELNQNQKYYDQIHNNETDKRQQIQTINRQVLSQWKERNSANKKEYVENRTKPHIEGNQGYPQIPQLNVDQEFKFKREQQNRFKSGLNNQIQRDKNLQRHLLLDSNKTTTQFYTAHSKPLYTLQDQDEYQRINSQHNREESIKSLQAVNQVLQATAKARQLASASNSRVSNSKSQVSVQKMVASIQQSREKFMVNTPNQLLSQTSLLQSITKPQTLNPIGLQKTQVIKVQNLLPQKAQIKKPLQVKEDVFANINSRQTQVIDRIAKGFEESNYRTLKLNRSNINQNVNIHPPIERFKLAPVAKDTLSPRAAAVNKSKLKEVVNTARGSRAQSRQTNLISPILRQPFSQEVIHTQN